MKWLVVFLIGLAAGASVLWVTAINQRPERLPVNAVQTNETQVTERHRYRVANSDEPRSPENEPPRESAVAHSADATHLDPTQEWNALAGGMLEWEVERLTGERLSEQKKVRLVAELARLREASVALQELPSGPSDPAATRERLMRTLALVEADRAFQKEIGMSVSEFLNEANSSAVEEVPLAPAAP